MNSSQKQKLRFAQQFMQKENIPFWIVYADEHRDPTFKKVVGDSVVPAILVANPMYSWVIVSGLDSDNIKVKNKLVYKGSERNMRFDLINEALAKLGFDPDRDRIALNYSTREDSRTDFIGYGIMNALLKNIRRDFGNNVKHMSAENIIYNLYERKTESELEKMALAAKRADTILFDTFKALHAGMTETDAYRLVHTIMREKPSYFLRYGVVSEELAWSRDHCPTMLTGPNLEKGGHAQTSNTKIEPGHTLYFDFGVKLTFQDGTSWCSDIQRMGYVLKKGENDAPPEVKKVFNTLVKAVDLGMESLKPGVLGYHVDEIVRNFVKKEAGVNYDHATGHALGEYTHNPGAVLSVIGNKMAHLPVQLNGVYTIEPRIPIVNGGSIEEDVVVRKKGVVEPLCKRQTQLYLVRF